MSRRAVAGGIPVRGTCRAGHVTEATSDPGRVSWEGPCAHDGCDLKVKAFRVRGSPPAPAETPAPTKTAPPADKPPRLRKVDYDAKPRKRDQPADDTGPAAAAATAGADGTGGAAAAAPAGGTVQGAADLAEPAAAGDADGPAAAERRAGIRERITGRRGTTEGRPRATREFRLPF